MPAHVCPFPPRARAQTHQHQPRQASLGLDSPSQLTAVVSQGSGNHKPCNVPQGRAKQGVVTRGSLMPVILSSGRSNTRKAARLAVYEATMIIAKPAHTMPRIRAEKLRGAPAGREERSVAPRGLGLVAKAVSIHMSPMAAADVHHLSVLPAAVQGASALPEQKKLQLLPGHTVCHPERVGNPTQVSLPCFPPSAGSPDSCHKCAPSASPNPLSACSREGLGNEVPQGPCERGRL